MLLDITSFGAALPEQTSAAWRTPEPRLLPGVLCNVSVSDTFHAKNLVAHPNAPAKG